MNAYITPAYLNGTPFPQNIIAGFILIYHKNITYIINGVKLKFKFESMVGWLHVYVLHTCNLKVSE